MKLVVVKINFASFVSSEYVKYPWMKNIHGWDAKFMYFGDNVFSGANKDRGACSYLRLSA